MTPKIKSITLESQTSKSPWIKIKEIAADHKASSRPQKQTAEKHQISEKHMSMILAVCENLHEEEIYSAPSLEAAYQIILKRKTKEKKALIERLFS